MTFARFLGLAGLLLFVACYKTPRPACAFRCGPEGECPEGYLCGDDTQCHLRTGGQLAECEPLPNPADAMVSLPDSGTPDASVSIPDASIADVPITTMPDAMEMPPDAAQTPDADQTPDAPVPDAPSPPDASPPDAAATPDAKTPDAATPDAPPAPDAKTADAT